jgi:hypothetical protein
MILTPYTIRGSIGSLVAQSKFSLVLQQLVLISLFINQLLGACSYNCGSMAALLGHGSKREASILATFLLLLNQNLYWVAGFQSINRSNLRHPGRYHNPTSNGYEGSARSRRSWPANIQLWLSLSGDEAKEKRPDLNDSWHRNGNANNTIGAAGPPPQSRRKLGLMWCAEDFCKVRSSSFPASRIPVESDPLP